ncbi:Y-family DNA polymerase [Xanthomonas arboricola]|uniref:Y-family DNA polymerase n=1 Tax=Xanthomonas arboricola TaxID=56448 RepID=UPI001AF1EBAF|nr:DNA polymerase Y family protein [Xanthomonas arboricola]CAD7378850.1 DNA polymerase Y family protein [Xanthomonas arboricola]CAG2087122.1 DNA polymerase Y family protein [Xanthomonas arboricola pv. juglandis]
MLWACILLPQLALDAVLRRLEEPLAPLVLVEGPAQLRSLHSVNAAAAAAGLKAGMRLSAAHALMSHVRTIDYEAQAEARTQRFLAAWAYRHSSLVSQQWSRAIVLEAGASFRLFGPWPRFERRLRDELQALGFRHRLALAPTPRAARVLAGLRDGMVVTQLPALHSTLDKVPVRRAALPGDAGERLQHMGVRTLAAVRALPRDGLRRRFGAGLLEHLDRLYGQVDDPLECYAPPDHFDQRVELGYEVEMHPALLFPLRRLIGDLCTYLSIRDGGVQRFLLRLEHEQGATDVEIGLLTPERAPTLLFELARNRLERVEIPRPVVAMRLLARQLPPFVPAMRDLFDQRAQQSVEWPQLRERLRARLGDEAVYRVLPADDPRPERAWRRAIGDAVRETHAPPRPPRPTWLLPQPVPLHETQLRIISGPERLESGWWDDDEARRDYYVVETARGRQAWVFAAPGRVDGWMLHGWFA